MHTFDVRLKMKTLLRSALLLALLFTSCAKNEEATILGTWVRAGDGKEVTMTEDGTYLMHLKDGNNLEWMWRSNEEGVLEIGVPNFDSTMIVKTKYRIRSNTLTVTDDEGNQIQFERKKDLTNQDSQ